MSGKVGVLSVGMQPYMRRQPDTIAGMVGDVTTKALDAAGLSPTDIDSVVLGSAVDAFSGAESSELRALPAFGAAGVPVHRVGTSGSTAVTAPILGYHHVAAGLADICLVVAYEQMSPSGSPQTVFNTVYDETWIQPIGLNVPIQCGLEARSFLARYGHTEEQMAKVSVKNHRNALDNPYAQLGLDLTVEEVLASPYISWPVKRLDTSPTTDGARAIVFAREEIVRELHDDPVWVTGAGQAGDSAWFMGRRNGDVGRLDYAYEAARQAYAMAGIDAPWTEVSVAEPYDPFTYKEMQHIEALGLCAEGESGKLIDEGVFERNGRLPVNPSGGLLGEGNPIGAGMSRVNWTYLQLAGLAGDCQVPGDPRIGVSCAWGGMYQYSAVIVLEREG